MKPVPFPPPVLAGSGSTGLPVQHLSTKKSVHPEVKRFLAGKGELRNWIYQRFNQHLNEGTGKARTGDHPGQSYLSCTQLEPIGVHDLVPGCHEVTYKLFVVVVLCVHFSVSAQDGVGTEH